MPGAADVVASLRALSAELDHLDEVAARHYGLNRTDMRALEIVSREGPVAPTELASRLGFTTGGITTVVDRLERAGYVTRRPQGSDRRRLVVDVTEATRKKDAQVFSGLGRATRRALATYSDRDLEVVGEFLDRMRQVTAAFTDSLGGADVSPGGD